MELNRFFWKEPMDLLEIFPFKVSFISRTNLKINSERAFCCFTLWYYFKNVLYMIMQYIDPSYYKYA